MSKCPVDYKQYIEPWSRDRYSNHDDPNQTIRTSGSAPTLCADIIATLFDSDTTPSTLAKLALEWGCRTYNSGTSWSYFQKVSEHYDFYKFVQSKEWNALTECIDAGGYVICAMRNGYWCKTANFVLAWNYDDKYVYCHDASSKSRRKQPIDSFKAESRMYFCFYPFLNNADK